MKKAFHLTSDGVNKLKAELDELMSRRSGIANKIKTAREQGDLTENAEYQGARDEQVQNETRIAEIDHILKNTEIIEPNGKSDSVEVGSTVELKNSGKTLKYMIVGSVEADPMQSKISDESPIGIALLGQKVGDEVTISLPAGDTVYKIAAIS
jgi:transcription elongation factor GreA